MGREFQFCKLKQVLEWMGLMMVIRQCAWVPSRFSRFLLSVTQWTVACQAPSSFHRILQARILEWVVISSSRGSSQPRDQTQVSCIAGGFLISWATRKAQELKWVAYPFSRGSFQPRNRTGVSCIAGRLFTSWASDTFLSKVALIHSENSYYFTYLLRSFLMIQLV